MTDLTPRDLHLLDQAAVDALSDVDALASDPETARRLAAKGEAVYGFELTRDLQAQLTNDWSLASWAAFATIRLAQARAEVDRLREQVFAQQPVIAAAQAWAEAHEDGDMVLRIRRPGAHPAVAGLYDAVEQYRLMDLALTNARAEQPADDTEAVAR
ncbi:hypothetical protein ACH5AJ_36645 [Streptomyces rochei]|uniref:hypothetical protein n=1 Tax=Streptomyces rochei TaxID=1928 RepID=UPI0037B3EB11